ncbi:MAG: hypothetical protein U1A27_11110 [Phycisphaerae bacterium]
MNFLAGLLARALDHLVITALAFRGRDLLSDSDAAPSGQLADRIQRWRGASCELERIAEHGPQVDYRAHVHLDGARHELLFLHERVAHNGRLIVYHHGLAERPPGGSYRYFLAHGSAALAADRICLAGLGHVPGRRDLRRRLRRIEGFEELIAASVVVAKTIADRFANQYPHRVLSGISLGGIVTLVESTFEPRFSANVALLATPFLSRMLLASSFTRLVHARFRQRVSATQLAPQVDVDRAVGRAGGSVVMVNGRNDTMVDIAALRAWWTTRPDVRRHELNCSHFSVALAPRALRQTFLQALSDALSPASIDAARRAE